MLVSANGRYPKTGISAFEALAEKHGLILIEDAAQALGSFYPDGRHIGTAGLVGSFSFSAPKIISTGQGGALVTNDDDVAERIRRLKDFGRSEGGQDVHDIFGLNFKFTELQACVGIEQMKKLPGRVERKKEIWRRYQEGLASCSKITLFSHNLEHTSPWFIDCIAEDRDSIVAALKLENIGTRVMYPPLNKQKVYGFPGYHEVSERIGRDGLWLPSQVQLTDAQIHRVCSAIVRFYS